MINNIDFSGPCTPFFNIGIQTIQNRISENDLCLYFFLSNYRG
uniref:Uncharacterized protein n=1 Tax=Arundo donax TaxID=35708 RepID=A0A0A9H295_ARUDO